MTTSTSARSASHGYPGEDAERTDPPRPSEDPADATGDGERRPDAPTEPPNKPEGTRGQRSQERVETRASRASRGVEEDPGEDGDEQRRPRRPDEPPGEPRVESGGPTDVKVKPGGKTDVERNGSTAHEDADAAADGRTEEALQEAQAEVESPEMRRDASIEVERWSASAHVRSTTRVEESGQRTSQDDEDIPGAPPDPHPPSTSSDEIARPPNEPPSVELEGERRCFASCDDGLTSDVADATAVSSRVEDDRNVPKNLQETSERVGERPERRTRENSPGRPGEEPEEPGSETAIPDGVHGVQELPRRVRNERVDETNAPCRANWPGGHGGEQIGWGDIEGDQERQSDGDGDQRGGRRGGKDGATSGARRDPKRVETTPLAAGETGQHGRRNRRTTDVPETSKPPPIHPRWPTDHPNPPRRRGRLKSRPRRVSNPRKTYQVTRACQGRIGRIGRVVHVVYEPEMVQESPQGAIREDEAAGLDRGWTARTY